MIFVVDEKRLEEIIEKSGHYFNFREGHVEVTDPTPQQKEFLEKLDRATDEFNSKIELEVDELVIQTINYLRKEKIESGTIETVRVAFRLSEYTDRKSKEIVDLTLTDIVNQYGLHLHYYTKFIPWILKRISEELDSRIYSKTLTETPLEEEIFGGGLIGEQREQYLALAETSGIIDPNTFNAFQLHVGQLGRTAHFFGQEKMSEGYVKYHTHPTDSWLSKADLTYGAPQMVISEYNTVFVRGGGPTRYERQEEILKNKDTYFPIYKPKLEKLRELLNSWDIEILSKTKSDIKFMEAPTDIMAEVPLTEIDEKSEIIKELREKSRKDVMAMFPPEMKDQAKQFADWAYATLPNDNWVMWIARAYRNDPNILTSEVTEKLKHFAAMAPQAAEVDRLRFEKNYSLDDGFRLLEEAQQKFTERVESKKVTVSIPDTATKLVDMGEYVWWDLGVPYCTEEGRAMGHCGNQASYDINDRVLSLRRQYQVGGKTYWEPHLTFIANEKAIGEMKGRGNEKPTQEYHSYIVELLKLGYIPFGGGYKPENNFHINDLNPELYQEAKNINPAVGLAKGDIPSNIESFLDTISTKGRLLVANRSDSAEILTQLAQDKDYNVLRSVALNQNTPPLVLDQLVDRNRQMRESIGIFYILNHRNLLPETLVKIATYFEGQENILRQVMSHPNTPPEMLNQFANDPSQPFAINMSILQNPNVPPEVLSKFASHYHKMIRQMVAENPNTPPEVLSQLAQDKDANVRWIVAQNPNTPPEILSQLTQVESQLTQMESEQVRRSVANNPNTPPEILSQLAQDKDVNVRWRVAANSNTPLESLLQLAQDEHEYVRQRVAENPNTPKDTEKAEIIKEWRERQSATQLPGVQVGGIHKPFVDIQLHDWEPPERRNFDIEEHIKRMLKEEEKNYPSPLQDGMDVVMPRSDNLEYGSDFGGRRFRLEEKGEERTWEKGEVRSFAFDPNSTKNEGRFRLYPPNKIKEYSRRQSSTPGISYVRGINTETGKDTIQAIRFDRSVFDEEKARKWWEENKDRFSFYDSPTKKEESRLVFDLEPQDYEALLRELQKYSPEEAMIILDYIKTMPKKIRPEQSFDARETTPRIPPEEIESEQEMYRRILEELEKE